MEKRKSTPIVLTVDEMKPSVFWTRKVIVRAVTAALEDVTNRKFTKNMQQALSFLAEFQEMRIKQ